MNTDSHEIERAVGRLNAWFAEHLRHVPRSINWRQFRRERRFPLFKAVHTRDIRGWTVRDLNRMFRVVPFEADEQGKNIGMPIEVLVADKSPTGTYLDAPALLEEALKIIADRHLLGRFSPRLHWFWFHYPPLVQEIESYVNGIRMRVDAATPVKHDQNRVFEEFRVPLEDGQQTAIGGGCFFVLEYAQPQGATPYWRFTVTRDNEVLVGPLALQARAIYHGEQLLAVVKKIDNEAVTLSVLTSEGGVADSDTSSAASQAGDS